MKFKIESRSTLFFFFVSLLAVVASRLWVASASPHSLSIAPGFENYDLGIIGLMSKHVIDKGEFPFFFWGQDWFGGLEACLHAVSFWIFGFGAWSMRLIPIFLFSVFTALTFLICRELFDERVARVSLLLCILPPLPWAYLSVIPHTHYLETPVLGSLILWLVIKLVKETSRVKIIYYGAWGIASGIAWWVTPLSVYYLCASAAFVLLHDRLKSILRGLFITFPFFLLGSLPWLIYSMNDPSGSFGAGQMYGFRWQRLMLGLKVIFTEVLPESLNITGYAQIASWMAVLIGGFYVFCVIFFLLKAEIIPVLRGFVKERKFAVSHSPFLLFTGAVLVIAATYSELAPGRMVRYLIPLYSFFPVAIAYAVVKTGKNSRYATDFLFLLYLAGQGYFFWNWGQNVAPRYEEKAQRVLNLIEKLKEKSISNAYIDRWLGPAEYTFMAGEHIIFSGPHHERYRPYELLLDQAVNPAFIYKKPEAFKSVFQNIGGQCLTFSMNDLHVYYDFREPAGSFLQIPAEEISLKASHDETSLGQALDRDAQTSWSSLDGKQEGMWLSIDTGKTRNLGMLRLWNKGNFHSNYPEGFSLEMSTDGREWNQMISNAKAKPFYWSGPRIYFWEWSYRWELRFGPVKARFMRLKLNQDAENIPWMLTELYVYEYSPSLLPENNREVELCGLVKKMGLKFIYADRYISARLREASGGMIRTIEPFAYNINKFVNKYSYRLAERQIQWTPHTGFVLEYSDAPGFKNLLERENISMSEINLGRWILFYFSAWDPAQMLGKNPGWWWMGLGMVGVNHKQTSDYFAILGKAAEMRQDTQAAVLNYKKALSLYENHQEARRSLIFLLNAGEADSEREILRDQTEPQNKVEAEFKNGACFLGYSLGAQKAAAGEKIPIRYFWRLRKDPGRGLGVFVHVEREGKIFQGDHLFLNRHSEVWPALEGEIFHQDEMLQIPRDAFPGEYSIYLGLFDVGTGKRRPVLKSSTASHDHRVCIGRIKIVE